MCSLARRGKQTSLKLQGGHKESSYNCQSLNTTKEKPNVLPWDNKKSTPRARHHSRYPSLHQTRLSKGTEPRNCMYIFIIKVGLLDLSVQQRLGTIVAVCTLEMQGTQLLLRSRRGTSQKYSLNVESLEVPWSPWSTLEGRERSRSHRRAQQHGQTHPLRKQKEGKCIHVSLPLDLYITAILEGATDMDAFLSFLEIPSQSLPKVFLPGDFKPNQLSYGEWTGSMKDEATENHRTVS